MLLIGKRNIIYRKLIYFNFVLYETSMFACGKLFQACLYDRAGLGFSTRPYQVFNCDK